MKILTGQIKQVLHDQVSNAHNLNSVVRTSMIITTKRLTLQGVS